MSSPSQKLGAGGGAGRGATREQSAVVKLHPPIRRPPLSILVDVQQELGGVDRGGGAGVQQQLLVLGQVLSRVLLGQPGTVEQLPLKQRQVGL